MGMAFINEHYLKLQSGYLFPEIARRVDVFSKANPTASKRIIRCGIGDVTEPLPKVAIEAMHKAVDELARRETFRGYPPSTGYDWLRNAIVKTDFHDHNLKIDADEIFVSTDQKVIAARCSTSWGGATRTRSALLIRSIPSTSTPT